MHDNKKKRERKQYVPPFSYDVIGNSEIMRN